MLQRLLSTADHLDMERQENLHQRRTGYLPVSEVLRFDRNFAVADESDHSARPA
jgi:hypothetical protein